MRKIKMAIKKCFKRGDIYYYDFGKNPGSIQSNRRPVLIVQDDKLNSK